MKKITKEELEVFLRKHKLWLIGDEDGEGADLEGADLRWANLRWANLSRADLEGADLEGADLRWANLEGAKNLFFPLACPEKGSFIGFKKANGLIIELLITEDAKRCSATSRKCRCNKAKVLSITHFDGSKTNVTEVASDFKKTFIYKVGEIVEVPEFNNNRWDECSAGIHFFITREEAVKY